MVAAKIVVGETLIVLDAIVILPVKDVVPKVLVVKVIIGVTGVTLIWSVTAELADSNVVTSAVVKPRVGLLLLSVLVKSNVNGPTSLETTGMVMTEVRVADKRIELVFTVSVSVVNNTDSVIMSVGNTMISVDSIGNDGDGTGSIAEGVILEAGFIIDVIATELTSSVVTNITMLVSVLCTLGSEENSKVAVNTSDMT